jgi:hypothetical protein
MEYSYYLFEALSKGHKDNGDNMSTQGNSRVSTSESFLESTVHCNDLWDNVSTISTPITLRNKHLENAGLVLVPARPVKKLPALYETMLLITVFSRANHWFL